MLGFLSNINYSDFLFLLPELWLVFSILHCLLIIARFNFQIQANEAERKLTVTVSVLKTALMHVQIALLFISLLFLQMGIGAYATSFYNKQNLLGINNSIIEFFAFNHQFVVDGYSLFFKFILFITVRLLLRTSIKYVLKHPKALMEFPILIQLVLFFLSVLISANDLLVVFIAVVGFSLNIYVLLLTDSFRHNSREAAMKYYYLSALSSGLIAFSILLCYLLFISTNFVEIT
jgi:NADH:ubiquinone oxidoreductase subunit 2 (subunit N)